MRFNADFEDTSPAIMRHILNLNRAFQSVPPTTKDIQVGRKFEVSALETMAKHAGLTNLSELKPGNVIEDPGVVSSSTNPNVWSGKVKMQIKVPAGSKAIDLSHTINKKEAEIMLPPGSKFKINKVDKDYNGFHYHIECELIS